MDAQAPPALPPDSPARETRRALRERLIALRRAAFKDGMRSLRLSGAQKVAAGLTTIEEVLRVTPQSEQK